MFYFRVAFVFLWLGFLSVVGLIYSLLRWGNFNNNRDFARVFSWGARKILGLSIKVEGHEHLESHQPCVYVANHQSNLDMATFGLIYPRRTVVIGKKEVKWFPFFGLFFMAAGNITIDRKKKSAALAGLSQAAKAIKGKGISVWIFPEGTRNRSGIGLLPFKKGAFHMAMQAGVPIVPIVSAPFSKAIDWKKRKIGTSAFRIKVLAPVLTQFDREANSDLLLEEVRQKMQEAVHGLI